MYNNFKMSLMVFMLNITTNHAITYTNLYNVAVIPLLSIKTVKKPLVMGIIKHFSLKNGAF